MADIKKQSIGDSVNYTIGGKKYSANDVSLINPGVTYQSLESRARYQVRRKWLKQSKQEQYQKCRNLWCRLPHLHQVWVRVA